MKGGGYRDTSTEIEIEKLGRGNDRVCNVLT